MTFPRQMILSLAVLSLGLIGAGACDGGGGSGGGPGPNPNPNPKPLILSFEQPARVIPSGDNPNKSQSLTVGDFDKDGDDDIATANETTNDVIVFRSNGDGSFTKEPGISTSATPSAITKGDFNGGGDIDLAVCKANDTMATLTGPAFSPPNADTAIGQAPKGIVAIDLDGDTDLDLVTDNSGTPNLSIMINNGGFNFTNTNIATPTKLANPQSIIAADFNADTRNDVAVVNANNNNVWIFFNQGGNNPANFFTDLDANGVSLALPPNSTPRGATVGDFNKDGRPDVAVPNAGADPRSVSVFINNGGGAFAPAVNYTIGTPLTAEPFDAATGDFNQDGNLDIVITNATAVSVVVLLGNGDAAGTFQDPKPFNANSVATPLTFVRSIGVGDFNKDGKPDVVAASDSQDFLSILINTSAPAP